MRAGLLWFLCGNFKIFVTMATGVALTQISLTQLNRQIPKKLVWCKNIDDISYTSWVIADFLIKFTNFCYHGNKGGSSEYMNDSIWSILCPNDVSLLPFYTRVGLTKIWVIGYHLIARPRKPQFGANILHVSLTVHELWLFKVAIGRNANFQILGLNGLNFNFY